MSTPGRRKPLSADTTLMAVGTFLSRLTGLGRLAALAYALGVSGVADAYNLANTTPNIVYDLVLGGVLSATLIPVFVDRMATRSEQESTEAISAVVCLTCVVLALATVVFVVAAPLLVRVYTVLNHSPSSANERWVATYLLRLFAPQLAFYGLITLMTALLNSRQRFISPMFAPIANNLVVIGLLIGVGLLASHPSLSSVRSDHGLLLALGIGTTLGVAAQAAAMVPSLTSAGLRLAWVWDPRHEAVATIARLSGWTFGFVATNQLALFVVLVLAVGVGPGTVSAYSYAYIFFQLPYGIVAVSIMSSMQPDMAQRWSLGDLAGFRRQVASGLRATLSTMVPAAVGYVVLARPIANLLLHHGAASSGGTESVAQGLTYLALGLPGFCSYLFLMRVYQSMQDTRTPFFMYLLENGINVVLAFALYRPLGLRGLALSLSVAYTVGAIVAFVHLSRLLGGIHASRIGQSLGRTAVLSAVMGAAVALVAPVVGSDRGAGLLLRVVVSVLTGVSVFFLGAGLAGQLSVASRQRRPKADRRRLGQHPSGH